MSGSESAGLMSWGAAKVRSSSCCFRNSTTSCRPFRVAHINGVSPNLLRSSRTNVRSSLVLVGDGGVGAVAEEALDDFQVGELRGLVQRRRLMHVDRIHIRTLVDQQLNYLRTSSARPFCIWCS